MKLETVAEAARNALEQSFGSAPASIPLELTQDPGFGDLTVNAFLLARELKKAPPQIAETLAAALAELDGVAEATAVKGFVNLRLERRALMEASVGAALEEKERFGRGDALSGQRFIVEFSAPNTNKPLHLGHLRNNFLGDSMSRILAFAGAEIIKANLLNDRGIHICKSMLAYERFFAGKTPESEGVKSDLFVGNAYVRFENAFQEDRDAWIAANPDHFETWKEKNGTDRKGKPLPEDELRKNYLASFKDKNFGLPPLGRDCQEMLRQWEEGDERVHALWKKMNGWALEGFEATYERSGISFDVLYRESETYLLGKQIIMDGLEKGIFSKREDGAVEIDLSDKKLGKKVLLRPDGTSIYITQDIGTTVLKAERHQVDGQMWVVADEQSYHFQVLFEILKRLGYGWAESLHHLAYGLVLLPDGRMKSREGRVVDADALIDEVATLAGKEIRERYEADALDEDEIARRAEVIALAAIRFMLLKVSPRNTMTFDPDESVRFEGDTGSRLLYAYARVNAMVQQAEKQADAVDLSLLDDEAERLVALKLLAFPNAAARAARDHNPSHIAALLLEISRELNRFYERCPVLKESDEKKRAARLALCEATASVLRKGCELLGITMLERM